MGIDFRSIGHLQEHEARLFPVVRISSDREAELRATSAFLAMVRAVSEFGRAIVKLAGGPAGNLTCYTEVSFENQRADAKTKADDLRPDGIIHVVRGSKEWNISLARRSRFKGMHCVCSLTSSLQRSACWAILEESPAGDGQIR